MKRIVCFHLYNDYSGSPKVLRLVLKGLLDKGRGVDLVTSRGGVLDELKGCGDIRYSTYRYRYSNNPVVTMLRFTLVQIYTFFLAFRYLFRRDVMFYINTLLPVGPALAGRLMGKKVVYHYHENAFVKGRFYRMLAWAMQRLASEIICVSAYQRSFLKREKGVCVIPNALPKEFVEQLRPNVEEAFERKSVLMLSSLKEYKGTREFIELAAGMPQYKFVLVINDTQENIDNYLSDIQQITPPHRIRVKWENLSIFSRQDNVAPFYNEASLVLNLTNPRMAIETFGLTPLEAMSCALPVIVPPVGGIAEMVEDGVNGYKIDVQELDAIRRQIAEVLSAEDLYRHLSQEALACSKRYDSMRMIGQIEDVLNRA